MKKLLLLIIVGLAALSGFAQQPHSAVGFATRQPDSLSTVEISSQGGTRGFMPPRLNKTQITALQAQLTPASAGMTIFNTTDSCLISWRGHDWSDCNPVTMAKFTIDCLGDSLTGSYYKNVATTNDNYWFLPIVVTKPGSYTFITDNINGIRFSITSIVSKTGKDTLIIPAIGTPKDTGTFTYTLMDQAGNSYCTLPMHVTANNAVFTLNCSNTQVLGPYTEGQQVDVSDQVILEVNVTKAGNYSFQTNTVDGYSFLATGVFQYPGVQKVTLYPTGTPVYNAGTNGVSTFDIKDINGTSLGCPVNVQVTSTAARVSVTNCASDILVNGQYVINEALTQANSLSVTFHVTKPGPYTFETQDQNGISFRASGIFGKTGDSTLKIQGSGTPAASGPWTYTLTDKLNNTTVCNNVQVSVQSAVGLLVPGTCNGGSQAGTWTQNVPLSSTTYTVSMQVQQAGPYSVDGSGYGITLHGSGTFTVGDVGGTRSIILTATGTPTTSGALQIMMTGVNGDLCNANLNVLGGPGTKTNPGISCADILSKTSGTATDGEYWIAPSGNTTNPYHTLCDMANGGYTMIWSYSEETNWSQWAWGSQIECDNSYNLNNNRPRGTTTADAIPYNDYRLSLTDMKNITGGTAGPANYKIRIASNAGAGSLADSRGVNNYVMFKSTATNDLRAVSSFSGVNVSNTYPNVNNSSNSTSFDGSGKLFGVPFTTTSSGAGTYNGSATTANGTVAMYYQQYNQFNLIFVNNPYSTKPGVSVRLFGYFDIDNQNGTGTGGELNDHFGKCGDGAQTCQSGSGTSSTTSNYYIKTGNNYVMQYFIK